MAVYQGKGRVRKWNPGTRTQAVGTQGDHEQKRVEVHWWRMGGSAILRGQQPVCCSGFNQKWKGVQFREVRCLSGVRSWLNVSRYLAGETSEGNPSFRRFWVIKNDYDYNTRSLISSMLRELK